MVPGFLVSESMQVVDKRLGDHNIEIPIEVIQRSACTYALESAFSSCIECESEPKHTR